MCVCLYIYIYIYIYMCVCVCVCVCFCLMHVLVVLLFHMVFTKFNAVLIFLSRASWRGNLIILKLILRCKKKRKKVSPARQTFFSFHCRESRVGYSMLLSDNKRENGGRHVHNSKVLISLESLLPAF